jgi:hypothetical protein
VYACGCGNFVSGFDKYDINEKIKVFQMVIDMNEWDVKDVILAVSDNHEKYIFKYTNGNLSIDNNHKCTYYDEYDYAEYEDEVNENNKRKRIDVN